MLISKKRFIGSRVIETSAEGLRSIVLPLSLYESQGQVKLHSYFFTTVDVAGSLQSLQLTGNPSEFTDQLQFSSINLGAPKQWVIDVLGLPSSITELPQYKTTLWEYFPFPFSFEMKEEMVYSMKIYIPSAKDLNRPFKPLAQID